MTGPADSEEVRKCVCFPITVKTKLAKRHDMMNAEFFGQLVPVLPANPAPMPVPVPGLVALLSPVRPIVGILAALPVGAILAGEVGSEPGQPALVTTKTLLCSTCRHLTDLAAHLASVSYPPGPGQAGARAIKPSGVTRGDREGFAASWTDLFDSFRTGSAGARAIHVGRTLPHGKGLATGRALPCLPHPCKAAFRRAETRPLAPVALVAGIALERLVAVFASISIHTRIVP